MSDTKILQALLDGQSQLRNDIKEVKEEVIKNGQRIDNLGLQLAELEDDSPTRGEYSDLKRRVKKIEKKVASI